MIKPTHATILKYYKSLQTFGEHNVSHESAVREAFKNLLADVASRERKWTLIPELGDRVGANRVIPDATLRDTFQIPRGYWEAKDTRDDLDAEICKKIARRYPVTNTIFEDTRTGVLYQDGAERFRADLSNPRELADLLNLFLNHCEPNIEQFEKAVDEFKQRVPELAKGLKEKIESAHVENPDFAKAFNDFFALCQQALNPNISRAAVDEMLVQHLLTERLFRTIFLHEEFTRRNVIAAEIEKVIEALVSESFSRTEFLKSLDRFYVAIEEAARQLTDFSEKQHFLNTVYERFFQGYSVKVADTHGIVYTPQPVVDFMCASVEEVLKIEFGKKLSDEGVYIIDPCTGTGNFVVNLLRRIDRRDLPRMYRRQMFANEVMLMPYYIAALNIEHAYSELTGKYESFEGLCFVDTLDLAQFRDKARDMFMTERNTERVARQKEAPITVVIGNPPYNVGQLNENDNNKNRKYEIDEEIRGTYSSDSKATNKNALSDSYVKFFKWASNRLGRRDGIICFISNNSFVHDIAFDGVRKHLHRLFHQIYVIDLKGNVRKGESENVFGQACRVGVSINIFVRSIKRGTSKRVFYFGTPSTSTREKKFLLLKQAGAIMGIEKEEIKPDRKSNWLLSKEVNHFTKFRPLGTKAEKLRMRTVSEAIFTSYGRGLETTRDSWVSNFSLATLMDSVQRLISNYNAELDRWKRCDCPKNVDDFVISDEKKIKWSSRLKELFERKQNCKYNRGNIRLSLYRPFCSKFTYFDSMLNQRRSILPIIFPNASCEKENRSICTPGLGNRREFGTLISKTIAYLDLSFEKVQCFPFYTYDEDGTHRRENITDWALAEFRKNYNDPAIEKWDVFYYVYGILHHPAYRTKYADCLKWELPRIPYAPDFRAFAQAGRDLAHWHLDYETIEPYELNFVCAQDRPLSYRVEKMRLSRDKATLVVNPSLTLGGIPPEVFEYRLGNRSALEWVIDQYQVKTDARSGIVSDPNRADDPEYIVRLVGQVVQVSLETVRIVKGLPEDFGDSPAD